MPLTDGIIWEVNQLIVLLILIALVYGVISGATIAAKRTFLTEVAHVGLFLGVCAISHSINQGISVILWALAAVVLGYALGRVLRQKTD